MILGDLGADVVKVEHPHAGDDTRQWGPPWAYGEDGSRESAYFLSINRNKRSVAADLKTEEGALFVQRLAREADVVVENFIPGTVARLGLDYAGVSRDNARVVYCSISGFGSEGTDSSRPGYDFTVQARAGWMAATGEAGGSPMKVGFALVDVVTGQNAAIAILAALRARDLSGEGQRVEVSLFDSAVAGLVNLSQSALVTGAEPGRFGNAHPAIVPYQLFETADRPIVVAVGNDRQWRRFCAILDHPSLADDPRFATNPARVEHRSAVVEFVSRALEKRTAREWMALLDAAAVPASLVKTVREALTDPALEGREGLWEMAGATYGSVRTVASPYRLERTPAALRRAAPALGEHTREISEWFAPHDP
jgi:crotonobetainyl-CoA:carnitine CoA-transferase CaiB-like acyl-CoA transferase